MKIKDAFTFDNGKWIAEVSDLEDYRNISLQSGQRFASIQEFIDKECTPHYTDDLDHELTHWTYNKGKTKVVIFND